MHLINAGKYQNRLLLIILGLIFILLLSWNGAFKLTLREYHTIRQLQISNYSLDGLIIKKQELLNEVTQLNAVLGISDNNNQTELVFEELVNTCKEYEKIRIVNYPELHQIDTNGYLTTTINVVFEGNYFDLLMLINKIESNKKIGKLVSVDLKKIFDFKKKKEFLNLTILLQHYEITQNL